MKRYIATALLAAAAAAVVSIAFVRRDANARPAQAVRTRMQLADLSREAAPGFTLVDQHGSRISLAALRGRAVVLGFMDPHCVDICPLVAEEFVEAARLLARSHRHAVFLAVNVNQFHTRVADVASFTRLRRLDRVAQWHFLTGPSRTLREVWHAYGVLVRPSRTGDVVHSSLLYFIDRSGRERWVAVPDARRPEVARWARDIAAVAQTLT